MFNRSIYFHSNRLLQIVGFFENHVKHFWSDLWQQKNDANLSEDKSEGLDGLHLDCIKELWT